jgi:ubiquitin carboxyl-terminal hydrolase 47
MYCYKDNREKIKEMTPEERREIQGRDSSRLDRLGGTSSIHSPRKERALKIYLDSSPRADPI